MGVTISSVGGFGALISLVPRDTGGYRRSSSPRVCGMSSALVVIVLAMSRARVSTGDAAELLSGHGISSAALRHDAAAVTLRVACCSGVRLRQIAVAGSVLLADRPGV